jgi:hypothetical protein
VFVDVVLRRGSFEWLDYKRTWSSRRFAAQKGWPTLCQTGGVARLGTGRAMGGYVVRGLLARSGFGLLTVRQAKLRSGGSHVSPHKAET